MDIYYRFIGHVELPKLSRPQREAHLLSFGREKEESQSAWIALAYIKDKRKYPQGRMPLMGIQCGMSGDTELFENPSNIKGLSASEQKIILYIPLF